MSNVLRGLLSAFDPHVDDAVLQCESEGHLRFVCGGQFIVHLMDDSASGDIRLIALASADMRDPQLENEMFQVNGWEQLSSIEDEFVRLLVLLHAETGVLAVVSSAPRARMDHVRFGAWLRSFLPVASDAMQFAKEFRAQASHPDGALLESFRATRSFRRTGSDR